MLQNSILFIVLTVLCFGAVIFAKKFMGKAGLFAWIAIASIVSNIIASVIGPMIIPDYGIFSTMNDATFANISFATILLANSILTKDYGINEGKKGVWVTVFSSAMFCIFMLIAVNIIPNAESAEVAEYLSALFGISGDYISINLASIVMLLVANLANVYIFDYLDNKIKKSPTANMLSNMFCNCVENFGFVFLGFIVFPKLFNALYTLLDFNITCNVFTFGASLECAVSTCLFEILLSLITPLFMFISDKIKCKE